MKNVYILVLIFLLSSCQRDKFISGYIDIDNISINQIKGMTRQQIISQYGDFTFEKEDGKCGYYASRSGRYGKVKRLDIHEQKILEICFANGGANYVKMHEKKYDSEMKKVLVDTDKYKIK
jgi:hypothetical protein